jgi:pyruvate/2-oxoacid:ferredoxin oxidoreductase beta subunit
MRPDDAVQSARLAVQTRVFPVYEIENGIRYTLNVQVPNPKPVMEYLKLQGRFRHLKEDQVQVLQNSVDSEWELLRDRIELGKKHG